MPRFYSLFVLNASNFNNKLKINDTISTADKTILDYLFELLNTNKCSNKVVYHIVDIIHNLVTYSDFNEMDNEGIIVKILPVKLNIDLHYDNTITSELNN